MEFRRSGQRDDRRRRVLFEETLDDNGDRTDSAGDGDSHDSTAASSRAPRYSDAARSARQLRWSELICLRRFTLGVWILLGLVAVAGVEALYVHVQQNPRWARAVDLTPLDVSARGSLEDWLASSLLGTAGLLSVAIFALRRHRLDDYRGRYRIWLPVAGLLVATSLATACDLGDTFGSLLAGLSSDHATAASADRAWLLVFAVVFPPAALRMAFEMRESRLALVSLAAAAIAYGAAGLFEGAFSSVGAPIVNAALGSTLQLLGHLAVAAAALTYARHVRLDSLGHIAVRPARRASEIRAERSAAKKAKAAERAQRKKDEAETRDKARKDKREAREVLAKARADKSEARETHDESHGTVPAAGRTKTKTAPKRRRATTDDATNDADGDDRDALPAGERPRRRFFFFGGRASKPTDDTAAETASEPKAASDSSDNRDAKSAGNRRTETARTSTPPRKPGGDDPDTLSLAKAREDRHRRNEDVDDVDDEDDGDNEDGLSRSERRRQKKLRRRESRRAA